MLKQLFDRLAGQGAGNPRPGELYSFETAPMSKFGAQKTGRYAAFKILGVSDELIVIGVLDGIWSSHPTYDQARGRRLLREYRFDYGGELAVFGTDPKWWPAPSELKNVQLLGRARVGLHEGKLVRIMESCGPGSCFSTPGHANDAAEGEWRWANDRDAYATEVAREEEEAALTRADAERRYRDRLRTLTFDQLLGEIAFPSWDESPPYPPKDFTNAARSRLRQAIQQLQALGPKPRRAEVRKILKALVKWFNAADEEAGGVIETEEREDICAALEELAFVARQRCLVDEIDQWREW